MRWGSDESAMVGKELLCNGLGDEIDRGSGPALGGPRQILVGQSCSLSHENFKTKHIFGFLELGLAQALIRGLDFG